MGDWIPATGEFRSAWGNLMGSTLCSVLILHLLWHWKRWNADLSAAWDKWSFPFLLQNLKERSRNVAKHVTVSTISFIQANLQHSIIASRVLTRTVAVKGIDMALIQEPWYCEGHTMDLNIPGSILFCASGIDLQQESLQGTWIYGCYWILL
jgi:hypothetical protein